MTAQRNYIGPPPPATPKQRRYLAKLARDNDYTTAGHAARAHGYDWDTLNVQQASRLIDSLLNGSATAGAFQTDIQYRPPQATGTGPHTTASDRAARAPIARAGETIQNAVDRINKRQEDNRRAYEEEQRRQGTDGPINIMGLINKVDPVSQQNRDRARERAPERPAETPAPEHQTPPETSNTPAPGASLLDLARMLSGAPAPQETPAAPPEPAQPEPAPPPALTFTGPAGVKISPAPENGPPQIAQVERSEPDPAPSMDQNERPDTAHLAPGIIKEDFENSAYLDPAPVGLLAFYAGYKAPEFAYTYSAPIDGPPELKGLTLHHFRHHATRRQIHIDDERRVYVTAGNGDGPDTFKHIFPVADWEKCRNVFELTHS